MQTWNRLNIIVVPRNIYMHVEMSILYLFVSWWRITNRFLLTTFYIWEEDFLTSAWQVYKLWQVKTIDIELLSRVNTSEKQIINRNPRDFLGTVDGQWFSCYFVTKKSYL